MKRSRKADQKKIARERVEILLAEALIQKNKANRYVQIARKIAMKANLKFPRLLQRKFCKHCYTFLNSKNSRVRITNGKIVITCFECKNYSRLPLTKNSRK